MSDLPYLVSTPWIIAALVIFQIKHLVADFLLQTAWMAHGKEKAGGWVGPLVVHAGIHAILTTLIFAALAPTFIGLGVVDFAVHFAIDRVKAQLTRVYATDTTKATFWWLIGVDQMLHHLTHLGFALVIALAHTVR